MFNDFATAVHARLLSFTEADDRLFFKALIPDLFEQYLAAFPAGTNPIFRERTEHDCNCCKQFIRNLGALARIRNGAIETLWDLEGLPAPYDVVAAKLAEIVRSAQQFAPYFSKERRYGTRSNFDNHDPSIQWHHFYGDVPRACLHSDPTARISDLQAARQVLTRGLQQIQLGHIDEVIGLIEDNVLYRGQEFLKSVKDFRSLLVQYQQVSRPDLFILENLQAPAARFRNTVIGTLLVDLAEGSDLEAAVKKFEAKVAPLNYKRPTALITPRMIEQAVAQLRDLGLENAVERRLARPEDLNVSDVLFVDASVSQRLQGSIEALLATATKPVKYSKATEIGIEEFISKRHRSIELILDRKHLSNFVSITAPVDPNVRQLFKWNNNFAWSYDGDVTDSIKERVKQAGGNVNALLRCSLAWYNHDDLDIHCITPTGQEIYYNNKCGVLDVDMNAGCGYSRNPVENLAWNSLQDGSYTAFVHNFRRRETIDTGFTLQVEFDGVIQEFCYNKPVPNGAKINALELVVSNGALVDIKVLNSDLSGGSLPVEKWGVKTGQPTKVTTAFLSPNHWHGAGGIGNKHWFFTLEGCVNPDPVRGIYNEFLAAPLERHRKVFEVLGSKAKCQPTPNQLSGVGFSATRRDIVAAVADGRPYKIVF